MLEKLPAIDTQTTLMHPIQEDALPVLDYSADEMPYALVDAINQRHIKDPAVIISRDVFGSASHK